MYLEIYMYKLANSDVFSESNGFRHKNVKKPVIVEIITPIPANSEFTTSMHVKVK